MTEMNSELLSRLVTGRNRDGQCRYDPQAKLELARQCMNPGVSVANMALPHGINANGSVELLSAPPLADFWSTVTSDATLVNPWESRH